MNKSILLISFGDYMCWFLYIFLNIDGQNSQVVSSKLLVNHHESQYEILSLFIIMYAFIFTYIVRNEPLLLQFQSYAQHTNNISWKFYLTKISNTILASIV